MNGPSEVLLDTNAVVGLLKGRPNVVAAASGRRLNISIVSVLEFRSFAALTGHDDAVFDRLLGRSKVIGLEISNQALLDQIILVRRTKKLKLPDAIIVGTAMLLSVPLVTADLELLSSIPGLQTIAI